MADFFKGLAGGFGTGLQLGQAIRERNLRDELAQAYAKPEEFTDYTPEQQKQIQGLQAAGGYDIQAVPGAEGQAPTLRYTARPGSGYLNEQGMPEAPIEIAPQRVQRYGGQTVAGQFEPAQLRGLQMREAARVLGASGDPVRASQLMQAAEDIDYQAQRRPLELQSLQGQIAGQGLTQQAQKLTISEAERKVKQDESNRTAQTMLAELSAAGTPIDTATANRIAKETGADMKFVTDSVLGQYNLTKASANDLIERQLTDFNKAAEGGIPTLNKYIAERLDPDKTDNIVPSVVQGKDGKLRVMYGDKPLPGYQTYSDLNQLSAAFQGNIKRDPLGAAIQISTLETQAQARKASEAAVRASDSLVGLRGEQIKSIRDVAANATERADIVDRFEALTDEEKAGAKGQGLIKQFNLLNVKAGGQVALGAAPKAATGPVREMSDLDKENLREYRTWLEKPKNQKLPQGQKDAYAAQLGVTQFINRAGEGPSTGVGSNPDAAPQQGVDTTHAPTPAAPPPAAPALTTENTKLLGRAGDTGYSVQLPDGTTRVMTIPELNRLGYQFPSGTGLQPAWYEGLMPRR